jgi:hypothetical protein
VEVLILIAILAIGVVVLHAMRKNKATVYAYGEIKGKAEANGANGAADANAGS